MLPFGLDAHGRHGPQCLLTVNFACERSDHFAGARRSQNAKLQSIGRHRPHRPQLRHKRRHVIGCDLVDRKRVQRRSMHRDRLLPLMLVRIIAKAPAEDRRSAHRQIL